ncbi:MAG: hypothetical protein J5486_08520 [Bacteroidaceae bacterium]|nr:hypothetical protein [Bacteroidaceae bacterium]
MKRIYNSPAILIVKLASERALLEGSLQINNTTVNQDAWVKQDASNSSSSSNYNVWNDDWSK